MKKVSVTFSEYRKRDHKGVDKSGFCGQAAFLWRFQRDLNP